MKKQAPLDQCEHCETKGNLEKCELRVCVHHQTWYSRALKQQSIYLEKELEEKDTQILTLAASLRRACTLGKELGTIYDDIMNDLNYKEAGNEEVD